MIQINNFSIKYGNKVVLENSNFEAKLGNITLITGESGSGKTSILNVLSLNHLQDIDSYIINGNKVDFKNEDQVRAIQNNYFAYVIQDYEMFTKSTIKENIEIIQSLSKNGIDYQEILKLVQLDHMPLSKKVAQMSGGEKQRLALALAIIRNTDYILLDEPTASLDMFNASIISDVLIQLRNSGKGIIVVTHNPEIIESDCTYFIKDNKLNKNSFNDTIDEKKDEIIAYKSTKLAKKFFKTRKKYHLFFSLAVGISLGIAGCVYSKGKMGISAIKALIDANASNEVLVFNHDGGLDESYLTKYGNFSISRNATNCDLISDEYPLYFWEGAPHVGSEAYDTAFYFEFYKDDTKVEPLYEETIYEGIQSWSSNSGGNVYSCDESNLITYKINDDVEKGCFIPKHVYEQYGLNDLNNVVVKFNVLMPIKYIDSGYLDSNDNLIMKARHYSGIVIDLELPVKGVIYDDKGITNEYGSTTNNIYYDYHYMEDIIETNTNIYEDSVIEYCKQQGLKSSEDQSHVLGYVVRLKDFDKLDDYKKYLEEINPSYTIASSYISYLNEYNLLKQQSNIQNLLSLVLVIVVIGISVIVQKIDLKKQIIGYSFFKINGVDVHKLYNDIIFMQVKRMAIISSIIIGLFLGLYSIVYESMGVFKAICNIPSIIIIIIVIGVLYLTSILINKKVLDTLSIQLLAKKS